MSRKLRNVYAEYSEYHEKWNQIRQSRINDIIVAVNSRVSKDDFDFRTKAELKYFEYLTAEADAYEEYLGERPVFEVGEIDFDDPVLDIYSDPV